jgi:hypothetical protein
MKKVTHLRAIIFNHYRIVRQITLINPKPKFRA